MKVKRILLSIALIIVLSIINFKGSEGIRQDRDNTIITAFKASEAEMLQVNISGSGKLNNKFLSENQIKKMGQDIIEDLHIEGILEEDNIRTEDLKIKRPLYTVDFVNGEDNRQLIISGKDKYDNAVTIILLTYYDKYSSLEETDLSVEIVTNDINRQENVYESIRRQFGNEEDTFQISTCITGTYNNKVQIKDAINIANKIVNITDAKRIEEYIQPNIISVSAYSPNIDRYIFTGNNKMNLNVAMRYNDYEGKTYIWVATPIITTGY